MSIRNHYEVLGVSKKATESEIKAAFRKLSMETHPDVAKDADEELFKKIAEAHSVLSNKNSRWKYDLQLQDEAMWKGRGGANNGFNNSRSGRQRHRHHPQKSTIHVLMETFTHPRFVVLGVATVGFVGIVTALLGGMSSNRPRYHHHSELVEAWKNPNTGRWEQPAPWDPLYRQLKPRLTMVPREKVRKRNVSNI